MNSFMNYFKLLRISHWIKNTFIFFPLFFDGKMFEYQSIAKALLAFFLFSILASVVYIYNDIIDCDDDRKHPDKSKRPIASGKITKKKAFLLSLLLFIIFFTCLVSFKIYLNLEILIILFSYLFLNFIYSLWLKKIAIIDVNIISLGFVLRILIGGAIVNIQISHWIIIMTYLITLFIAFAKRKDDLIIMKETGELVRKSSSRYSIQFLELALSILASVTVVAYLLYCVSDKVISHYNTDKLFYTSIFVIIGILRYLQLTIVDSKSGSPIKILYTDVFLQIVIILWVITFSLIIYL